MMTSTEFAPLQVVLPESLQHFFAERGYLATTSQEERTHARLNVRSIAHIHFPDRPAALHVTPLNETRGSILVKDLSKTGVAFLYHQQVFPGESFEVFLNGRILYVTAVRCRRLGYRCYETGATISGVELADSPPDESC